MIPNTVDAVATQWVKCNLVDIKDYSKPDYKVAVSSMIQTLLETPRGSLPPTDCRIHITELITEAYFNKMEEYPSSYDLQGLANYIMLDYIKSVNKCKADENQFLSDKQEQRRTAREFLVDTTDTLIDFLYCKYALNLDSLSKKKEIEVGD